MTDLKKYYYQSAVIPGPVSVVLMTILSVIDNQDYESEWFTGDEWVFITFLLGVFFAMAMAIVTCSLFLNRHQKVRDSVLSRLATWFLFPLTLPGFLILSDVQFVEFLSPAMGILIITAPYLVGLSRSYYLFTRKENRSGV